MYSSISQVDFVVSFLFILCLSPCLFELSSLCVDFKLQKCGPFLW